jgi:hypothetical protein
MNLSLFLILVPLLLQPQDQQVGKAARINDEVITWEELRQKYRGLSSQNLTPEFLRAALRQEAEERLFLQEANRRKIEVSEEEIDQAVSRVVRAFGGKEVFEQYLRYRNLTVTQYREQSRKELLESRLYRKLIQEGMYGQSILLVETISPNEIRDYYNANHEKFMELRHVDVFRIAFQFRSPVEKESRKILADSVRRRLLDSSDRYMTAMYYSDIRASGAKGADPFVLRRLQKKNPYFSEKISQYLFSELPVHTYSPVLLDGNSWNIFYLLDRVNKPADSFETAQLKIRSELENQRRQENRKKLLQELLKNSYVDPADLFQE